MIKPAFVAASFFAFLFVTAASFAQMPPAPQGNGQPQGHQMGGGGMMRPPVNEQDPQAIANRQAEEELMLRNRKAEMLLRINNHLAEVQKDKACIESAASLDALRNCKPNRGPQQQGGGMMGGHGMQGGMMMRDDGGGQR